MAGETRSVPGHPYLYEREGRYRVRVQVPSDVRAALGKREFKKSFGGDAIAAKQASHAYIGECFAKIRSARDAFVSSNIGSDPIGVSPDLRAIEMVSYAHFQRMGVNMRGKVAEPVGEVPGSRENRADGFRIVIKRLEDAYEQDTWSTLAADAQWICEEKRWSIDRSDPKFEFLCRTLLRAKMQCYRNELRHIEGKLASNPDVDPLFGDAPPKPIDAHHTLGNLIDKFILDRRDKWSASTKKNYIIITRVLEEICGRETPVDQIDKDFCRNIRSILSRLPSNYQKLPVTRGRSINEAIEIGEALNLSVIKPATINAHLNKLGAVVRFGRDEGWIVGNPMAKMEVNDPVNPSEKRDPFSIDQLNILFSSAPWSRPFDPVDSDPSRYWAPLISLFTGARLTEICGQLLEEMIEIGGVPAFNFAHRPGERHIKGRKSRLVPIHPYLLEHGFWVYVERARERGQRQLFQDAKRDQLGKWGDSTSKWFSRKVRHLELQGEMLSFHSFRHSFEDALRDADLHDTPMGNAITGRWSPGVSKNYGSKYRIMKLRKAIGKVTYPGLILGGASPDHH